MKLEWLQLENFRQYEGRQQIAFSRDPSRNVTVIHGVNGAGKTSMFLALNWCLYGEGFADKHQIFSKGALNGVQFGERVTAAVEVTFTHEGERYSVRRSATAVKRPEGGFAVSPDEFTMMRTRGSGQAETVRNPANTMNVILPSNVRTYFLFDGEKIDNFAKPEAAGEIREAIRNVLKLEVLTRGRRHLEEAAAEYRAELRQLSSGELKILLEEVESYRAERQEKEDRRRQVEAEMASARSKIREIDQRLAEKQEARVLQERRESLSRELKSLTEERERLVGVIRDLATGAYLIVAAPEIASAAALLDVKRERGEIPSDVRKQFVVDLLAIKRCVCGRTFEEDSDEQRALLDLLSRSVAGSVQDDAMRVSAALGLFPERAEQQRADLARAMRRRQEVTDQIAGVEIELDEVSGQLKGSPQEEISGLEKRRSEFTHDVDRGQFEFVRLGVEIEGLSSRITETERKIEHARKEEDRQGQLTARMGLAQQAADAIKQMYQSFAEDMRQRIEAETKATFQKLIWKDTQFQDVTLGMDYDLQVIDRWGQPARPDLSAGERQVLSLSFITAMSRVSEEEAPLVMDTPFGRLSSHHREAVTSEVPSLTNQLILFVTDEELRDQARANLEQRIGAEYRLIFDQATGATSIEEVV